MGNSRVMGDRGVWMTWGGWGSGASDSRAKGLWRVAGLPTAAVSVRLVDTTGRVLDDDVDRSAVPSSPSSPGRPVAGLSREPLGRERIRRRYQGLGAAPWACASRPCGVVSESA